MVAASSTRAILCGCAVGAGRGRGVGRTVGFRVGWRVGLDDGSCEGFVVGPIVGFEEGRSVAGNEYRSSTVTAGFAGRLDKREKASAATRLTSDSSRGRRGVVVAVAFEWDRPSVTSREGR